MVDVVVMQDSNVRGTVSTIGEGHLLSSGKRAVLIHCRHRFRAHLECSRNLETTGGA